MNKLILLVWMEMFSLFVLTGYAACLPEDFTCQYDVNPTPETFNSIPEPTAANLEKLPNPTIPDFNRLNLQEQENYLTNNYRTDFAKEYVSKSDFETAGSRVIGATYFEEEISHINKMTDKFKLFVEKRYGVVFKEIKGEFESFDKTSKRYKTKGEESSDFSLEELSQATDGPGYYLIDKEGRLRFEKGGKEHKLIKGRIEVVDGEFKITAGEIKLFDKEIKLPAGCENCVVILGKGDLYYVEGEDIKLGEDYLQKGSVWFKDKDLIEMGDETRYAFEGLGEFFTAKTITISHEDYLVGQSDIVLDKKTGVVRMRVKEDNLFQLDLTKNPKYNLLVPVLSGGEIIITQGSKMVKGFPGGEFGDNNQPLQGIDVAFIGHDSQGGERYYLLSSNGGALCEDLTFDSPSCKKFVESYYAPEIKEIEQEGGFKISGKNIKKYGSKLAEIRGQLESLQNILGPTNKVIFLEEKEFSEICGAEGLMIDGCATAGIVYLKEAGLVGGVFAHEAVHNWRFATGSKLLTEIKTQFKDVLGKDLTPMYCPGQICFKVIAEGDDYYIDDLGKKGNYLGKGSKGLLTYVWEDTLVAAEMNRKVYGTTSYWSIDPVKLGKKIQETGCITTYSCSGAEEVIADTVAMIKNNPSEFSFFVADANYILKTGKVFPERIGSAKTNLHSKRIIQTLNTLYKNKAITKQEYDKVMEAYRVTVTKQ